MGIDNLFELRKITGAVHHIESFGTVDGPGLRYVVFLQGCPLRCLYCHNPDAIPRSGGTVWSAGDLVREILRYKNFIKTGGVTFSGGEPLLQAGFVKSMSILLHSEGIHVAIDTAGCLPIESVQNTIDQADLLLLDIKATNPDMCRELTGIDNRNAFNTLDYCEQKNKSVWIRHVLLRGYTLDENQLKALAERLRDYKCIEKIELLPFHKLGEAKWEAINKRYTLSDVPATTKEEAEAAKALFHAHGFTVL